MRKDENYFGIKLNDDVPKLDKINEYSKEVEIKFIGQAFLVERKDDEIIKTEIKNYFVLDEEDTYEIEFINTKNEIYNIQVRIKKSYLLFIILFFLAFFIGLLLTRPIGNQENLLSRFYDFIDLSVLELNIENKQEIQYDFDVTFKNLTSQDVDLKETINKEWNGKSVAKNKIAPGVSGSFSILMSTRNSMVDMKYRIKFEDITKDKPNNLLFKIRGKDEEFYSLQELEQYLNGRLKKHSLNTIVIEWRWPYEINPSQDLIDTRDGKSLENYRFKITVKGEEVL